jgi:hypothetical protein
MVRDDFFSTSNPWRYFGSDKNHDILGDLAVRVYGADLYPSWVHEEFPVYYLIRYKEVFNLEKISDSLLLRRYLEGFVNGFGYFSWIGDVVLVGRGTVIDLHGRVLLSTFHHGDRFSLLDSDIVRVHFHPLLRDASWKNRNALLSNMIRRVIQFPLKKHLEERSFKGEVIIHEGAEDPLYTRLNARDVNTSGMLEGLNDAREMLSWERLLLK